MKILIVDDEDIQRQKLVQLIFRKPAFFFLIFYVHLRYRLP